MDFIIISLYAIHKIKLRKQELKCYLYVKANFAQKSSRLADKKGIPISDLIKSANTNDIKAVIDGIENAIIK
jgi:hypothetical protein